MTINRSMNLALFLLVIGFTSIDHRNRNNLASASASAESSTTGSDYYALLGVSRDADDRTIRRAFKKLAIQLHPDKNPDDPQAHDTFVRVNRAYEVLKDEQLRKKYDQFGEDGLKDGHHGGQQQYQSWQFYKYQFGIYDDDPEISTLNGHDFDTMVVGDGKRRWFINFYSAQCSHCHELAPAWRQFARQVEGIIGVGAVNCLDEFFLCQQQHISHYPMLVMYPEGERYDGARTVDDLADFVLSKLGAIVEKLTVDNLESQIKDNPNKPWLIDLCNDETESSTMSCLSWRTRKLVAAGLDQAIKVAVISCSADEELCEKVENPGLYFFHDTPLRQNGKRIQSLDAKEIISIVWNEMPELADLDELRMKEMLKTGKADEADDVPWLVQFTKHGAADPLEYRSLPTLLSGTNIKIGRFNCSKYTDICQSLNLNNFPTFVLFKPKVGYEIHYGKPSVHDVATFAKDCAFTNARTLSAEDFFEIMASPDSTQPWFIDFFAPWCPPCMRLLPEFRKAAKILGDNREQLRFGTIDCTMNNQACQRANVHSYPTTVLFNGSKTEAFVGLHNVAELIDFIEDIKNPPVIALTAESFQEKVLERNEDEIWMVDFMIPTCPPCQQLAPEMRKLSKMFIDFPKVFVAELDCSKHGWVCQQQYIQSYPTIRAYPRNRGAAIDYNSWFRDVMSMRTWLHAFLPSRIEDLTEADFYELLDNKRPVVVDFFAPWCGHCQTLAPEYEKAAEALDTRIRFAKVNCDLYVKACQAALVRAYPSIRFYPGVGQDSDGSQSAYGIEIHTHHSQQLITTLESLLTQFKREDGGDVKEEKQSKRDEL